MCKLNNGGPPLPCPHTQLKIYRTETLDVFSVNQLHSKNHAVQKQMRSSQNRDSSSLFCEGFIQIQNKTRNAIILQLINEHS